MKNKKKLKINKIRDLQDLKKNLTLAQIKTRIVFDEKILCAGLVMTLQMEMAFTERVATKEDMLEHVILS